MLPRSYESQKGCPVAKTLEVVGDRWTMLIVREAFWGTRRFDDFTRRLGIARTVLTDRLARLVEDDVMRRERYLERPERFEYRLSEKGLDLWPVLMALRTWGERYAIDGTPAFVVVHRDCGGRLDDRRICTDCGGAVGPNDATRIDTGASGTTAA